MKKKDLPAILGAFFFDVSRSRAHFTNLKTMSVSRKLNSHMVNTRPIIRVVLIEWINFSGVLKKEEFFLRAWFHLMLGDFDAANYYNGCWYKIVISILELLLLSSSRLAKWTQSDVGAVKKSLWIRCSSHFLFIAGSWRQIELLHSPI